MLTEREKRASEAILDAIYDMDPRGRLTYNTDEVVQAIHVLQSFLKQHVLNRQDPENWSDWWEQKKL
jgi:hypothetical protein